MKILYLHQYFQTPQDAGGTRSYYIAKHLISLGHQVKMVYATSDRGAKNKSKKTCYEGIQLIELNYNYSNKFSFLRRALIFLKFSMKSCYLVLKEDYDLIYATSTPLTVGIPALVAKFFRGKKFIFEVRDLWPELPKAMGIINSKILFESLKILEINCYKYSDYCIGLSPGIVDGINKYVSKNKTILIPNYSNVDFFKEKNNFSNKKIKLIYAGAFGYANGLDNILDLAKFILKNLDDPELFEFHFYGTGIKLDHLKLRIEKENIINCKIFLPVSKIKLKKIFNLYDLGIMSLEDIEEFYYGTSPNKFFDYIAAGLPVLCNYPGWVSELIIKHNCGFSLDLKNKNNVLKVFKKMIANKNWLKTQSKNSRRLAENFFSDKVQLKKITKIIESYK